MDFKTLVTDADGLCNQSADALLILLAGDALPGSLGSVLSKAVGEAVDAGDLALKAGKSLYLHRVGGVKAPRVAVSAAGASTP